MLPRMNRALWVFCALGLFAAACGDSITVVDDPAAAGSGGDGAAGVTTGVGASGTGGVGGPLGECESESDCPAVECEIAACDEGLCAYSDAPAGTPCGNGFVCDGSGNCSGLSLGDPCVDSSECASGFCADGVCCEGACDGLCEGCNAMGTEGSCTPQAAGTDPDSECAGDGVCDGALECASGEHVFSGSYGASSSQFGRDAVFDSSGNVLFFGYFFDSINLGGMTTFTSAGFRDMFLARYDMAGANISSQQWGAAASEYGWEIAIDAADNIYLAGRFRGTFAFDALSTPHISQGETDIFVAMLDPMGNHVWSDSFGGVGFDELWSLDVSSSGNVVIGGYFRNTVDFGDGMPVTSAGLADGFVASYDSMGNQIWYGTYGDAEDQRVYGTAFDSVGNIIVTGRHYGSIDFGGGPLVAGGTERDLFLVKLDPMGIEIWAQDFGGNNEAQLGWDVAIGLNDEIAIGGYNRGTIDFGGGVIGSNDGKDAVVAMFDAMGGHLWSVGFGGPGDQEPNAIHIDSKGHLIIVGDAEGDIDFGGGLLASAGQQDAFIAKFDRAGTHLWSRLWGGGSDDIAWGVSSDPVTREIVAVGYHASTIDLGGGAMSAGGGFDAFMVKLSP